PLYASTKSKNKKSPRSTSPLYPSTKSKKQKAHAVLPRTTNPKKIQNTKEKQEPQHEQYF
ncbi:MAG: hypothetical protein IJ480_02935, partial [Clostridia bacterium]|nr:hypothetical protein [Clostridia bacterium]